MTTCNWLNAAGEIDPSVTDPANIACLEEIFKNVVGAIVGLSALALFVMLIIGGFKYLTSAGDAKKTESARNTMFWAIMGIVIMIASYAILFTIETFTGVNVTVFDLTPDLTP